MCWVVQHDFTWKICYVANFVALQKNNYRVEKKSLQILLSRTQAEPGRTAKQEQEEISRNHVPRLFLGPVYMTFALGVGRRGSQKSRQKKHNQLISVCERGSFADVMQVLYHPLP